MTKRRRDPIVDEAIRAVHGLGRLADAMGISVQAIWWWNRRGVPPSRVLQLERVTGIPRERIRPDLYGAPRPRPRSRLTKTNQAAA